MTTTTTDYKMNAMTLAWEWASATHRLSIQGQEMVKASGLDNTLSAACERWDGQMWMEGAKTALMSYVWSELAPQVEAQKMIATARANISGDMASSAELCADEAQFHLDTGDTQGAFSRAMQSLMYGVGVFSPIYKENARIAKRFAQ